MKATERHHLKQNEFAVTASRMAAGLSANRNTIVGIVAVVAIVGVALWGYLYFRGRTNDRANSLCGAGLTIERAQIVPAPTVPGATQAAGTYPTEAARAEAALAAFQKVVDQFPSHEVGTAARYHRGGVLLSLNRAAEAEAEFKSARANGGSSLYAEMAQLGEAQALVAQQKFDAAINLLTTLSATRDSRLPIDGVLMELARVSRKAGKTDQARAAFRRVVDEFPESGYAGEARQQLATLG